MMFQIPKELPWSEDMATIVAPKYSLSVSVCVHMCIDDTTLSQISKCLLKFKTLKLECPYSIPQLGWMAYEAM